VLENLALEITGTSISPVGPLTVLREKKTN
jgi:hypothetical protein